MKIVTNNAAYVQKNDLIHLNQSGLDIPASVYLKVFGQGITIVDDSNRYEFVKYEKSNEIEFFKNIDWMVEYTEVKDLTENEIMELAEKINEEMNTIADTYNSMSDDNKRKNYNMTERFELLEFKMYSLRDVLWFKQGHLTWALPEDIEYPAIILAPQEEEEKGIKKLVKSIFNKNKRK